MIDGGALSIEIIQTQKGPAVEIDAPPMVSLCRMLAGKAPADAGRLAGAVYARSPSSEAAAIAAATGQPIDEGLLRGMVVEALHEHAVKMLAAWPAALGHRSAPVPAPGTDNPISLASALFGDTPPPCRIAEFEAWMKRGATPAARVLDEVWQHWDARWGRAALPLWSPGQPLGRVDWAAAVIDGAVADTGLVARVGDSDLLREIEARRGRGIVWRLAARIVDAGRLLDRLRENRLDDLAFHVQPGVGAALAPNGTVLVEAETEGEAISRYQRLSPADFALHPGGLMHKALATLPKRSRAPLGAIAGLIIEAIDPGIPTRLTAPERRAA
jgi:hypothetical protein